jgi:hypothetical protein
MGHQLAGGTLKTENGLDEPKHKTSHFFNIPRRSHALGFSF